MKKRNIIKKVLCSILTGIILMAAVVSGGCSVKKTNIRIGTAGKGGMYYSFGTAFAKKMSSSEYDFKVKETAGSAANLRLLSEGYIEIGIAQADLIDEAYNGTGEFSEKSYKGYSAITGLYTEVCHIIVTEESCITQIDDLQDKKVSIGEKESGSERNAKQILEIYGLNSSLMEMLNYDYETAADKLIKGEIDAMFCTTGIKTEVIERLSEKCKIKILSIGEKELSKITSAYDFLTEYTIPADTYKGQIEDVKTVGVKSVLLASDKLEEDIVYKITEFLYENAKGLQFNSTGGFELSKGEAMEGITINFHKGAMKYYNKKAE